MVEVGFTLPLTQQSDTDLGFKAPIDEETWSLLRSFRTFEKDIIQRLDMPKNGEFLNENAESKL